MKHVVRKVTQLHKIRLYSVRIKLTLSMLFGMLLGCITFLMLPKESVVLDIGTNDWCTPLWALFRMAAPFLVVFVLQLLNNGDRFIGVVAFLWGYILDFTLCCTLLSGGFPSGAHFISELLSVPVFVWFFCGCAIQPCIERTGVKFQWYGWGRRWITIVILLVLFISIEQWVIKYFFT